VAIAPVLKKALEKGINVVGYDANSTPDARQWFVNQAEFNGIAKALVDNMAAEIGGEGGVAIVTSTFTTPEPGTLDRRDGGLCRSLPSEAEVARDGRSPGRQQPVLQPGHHAHQQVWRRAEGHLRHDLGCDAGIRRSRDPGQGKCGSIAVVGLATPNAMKPYVGADCVKSVVLWNPVDLGYAAMHVLRRG
jgi:rhamnose transport system substrate-binding protein